MTIHVGNSGWSYGHWHGGLYQHGPSPHDRLGHHVQRFRPAELNASFYRWPRPGSFARWRRVLPDGFQLSVKAPRGPTHGRRLYGPEAWIERGADHDEVYALLERHAAAYCVMSGAHLPCRLRVTAPFA